MIITEIKINLHVLSVSILMLTREPETHCLLVHVFFFSLVNAQYVTQCQIYMYIEYLYK